MGVCGFDITDAYFHGTSTDFDETKRIFTGICSRCYGGLFSVLFIELDSDDTKFG